MKKRTFLSLAALAYVVILGICGNCNVSAAENAQEITLPENGICAHRGNNAHFPENTVPAFLSAVELGVAQVELDVYYTKDKKMIVMHDDDVARTTTGKGLIREKTLAEIKSLGIRFQGKVVDDVRVPTFEEVVSVLPKNIWINIHVKDNKVDLILEIAAYLKKEGRLHQSFLLCNRNVAQEARKTYPTLKICNPPGESTFSAYVDSTIALGFEFVQPNPKYAEMPKSEIQRLHDAGVKINYFGVKNAAHCRELLEMGVDFPLCDDVTACATEMSKK